MSRKTITIIIVVAVLLLLTVNKGFRNLVSRKIQEHKLRSRLNEIQAENERLKQEINRLEHDDRHIEYRIRRDLGYIKKGEVEYRLK